MCLIMTSTHTPPVRICTLPALADVKANSVRTDVGGAEQNLVQNLTAFLGLFFILAATTPVLAASPDSDTAANIVASNSDVSYTGINAIEPIATVVQAYALPQEGHTPPVLVGTAYRTDNTVTAVIPARDVSPYSWVLGVSVSNGPVFSGSDRRSNGIRPVFGLKYGRYTISSGGGGSLLDFDIDAADSGVSARLLEWENFRLSATLRLDHGREGGDDEVLSGLPDVDKTLRGRISGVYDFTRWASVKVAFNQDLMSKGGGGLLSTTFRYEYQVTPRTEFQFAAGFDVANTTHMRSYYGVPASAAGITTNLPQFDPRGGLQSTSLGVELKTALTDHWVLSGGVRLSQLRGDARRSPLALKPNNYRVYIGLAYRY